MVLGALVLYSSLGLAFGRSPALRFAGARTAAMKMLSPQTMGVELRGFGERGLPLDVGLLVPGGRRIAVRATPVAAGARPVGPLLGMASGISPAGEYGQGQKPPAARTKRVLHRRSSVTR